MRSRPFCFRVGFGLGFNGRGKAPGGNTAGSLCKSVTERLKRGITVLYGSVIKGSASQLFILVSSTCFGKEGSVDGRRNFVAAIRVDEGDNGVTS